MDPFLEEEKGPAARHRERNTKTLFERTKNPLGGKKKFFAGGVGATGQARQKVAEEERAMIDRVQKGRKKRVTGDEPWGESKCGGNSRRNPIVLQSSRRHPVMIKSHLGPGGKERGERVGEVGNVGEAKSTKIPR